MLCEKSIESQTIISECLKQQWRPSVTAMAHSIAEARRSRKLSAAGKIELHTLGGVCAGEARVAASFSDHSIGHNEVFDLQSFGENRS